MSAPDNMADKSLEHSRQLMESDLELIDLLAPSFNHGDLGPISSLLDSARTALGSEDLRTAAENIETILRIYKNSVLKLLSSSTTDEPPSQVQRRIILPFPQKALETVVEILKRPWPREKMRADVLEAIASQHVDSDSQLCWHVVTEFIQPAEHDPPRVFLRHAVRARELANNPSERQKLVLEQLNSWKREIRAFTEFGGDIPVIIEKDGLSAQIGTYYFGYPWCLVYSEREGLYHLVSHQAPLSLSYEELSLDLPTEALMQHALASAGSPFCMPLTHRKVVNRALGLIRASGRFNTINVDAPLEPNLPFKDAFDPDRRNVFFGDGIKDDLVPIRDYRVDCHATIVSSRMRDEEPILAIVINLHAVPETSCYSTGAQLLAIPLKNGSLDTNREAIQRQVLRIRKVRIIEWSNDRATLILDRPLEIPKRCLTEPEAAKIKGSSASVPAVQSFITSLQCFPLFLEPVITVGDGRFRIQPIVIRFNEPTQLVLDHPLNRTPLSKRFDPELRRMGFPEARIPGVGLVNCLTDGCTSIPFYRRPSDEQFRQKEFQAIAGLQPVPASGWNDFMTAIEGDWLDGIRVAPPSTTVDSAIPLGPRSTGQPPTEGADEPLNSPFGHFRGPRESITIIGGWIVSHCQVQGRPYYVLERPFYGNAIYLFSDQRVAENAGKLFSSAAAPRLSVLNWPLCIGRVPHTENWRENLDNLVETWARLPRTS